MSIVVWLLNKVQLWVNLNLGLQHRTLDCALVVQVNMAWQSRYCTSATLQGKPTMHAGAWSRASG